MTTINPGERAEWRGAASLIYVSADALPDLTRADLAARCDRALDALETVEAELAQLRANMRERADDYDRAAASSSGHAERNYLPRFATILRDLASEAKS